MAEVLSKLTAKGQMTLPREAREHLRVKAGDKVKVFNLPDGTVVLLSVRPITSLRGLVKSPLKRPLTIEEMDDAIAEGAIASLGIAPHPVRARLGKLRKRVRK
jgi:AbrB family looped-hinge helix DNA binding protein